MAGTRHPIHIKKEITALLQKGFPPDELSKQYDIPLSSIKNFPKEMGRLKIREDALASAISELRSAPTRVASPSPKKDGVSFENRIIYDTNLGIVSHGSQLNFTRPADNTILFDGPIDIGVLPDTQVKPQVDVAYLGCYGRFFAQKKPKVILQGGDFADMPSLSFHDAPGSKGYEGQRYKEDILAVHQGMKALMTPILDEMAKTDWRPLLIMTLGNHENRINRTIAATPKLDGVMGLPDLEYERWGWEVYPFLVPVIINGVAFAHYFTSGVMGRPITSAQALLTKKHMSCFAFHQQGRDVKHGYRGDGKEITAGIFGSAYEHDEDFLNHQTNLHFRGGVMLYGVEDGVVDSTVAFNLKWLKEKYA